MKCHCVICRAERASLIKATISKFGFYLLCIGVGVAIGLSVGGCASTGARLPAPVRVELEQAK